MGSASPRFAGSFQPDGADLLPSTATSSPRGQLLTTGACCVILTRASLLEKAQCLGSSESQHITTTLYQIALIAVNVRLRLKTVMHDNLEDEVRSKEPRHVEARKSFCDRVGRLPINSDERENRLVCARHRRKRRVPVRRAHSPLQMVPAFVTLETSGVCA